jgi:excisionase family DNA binding protein
MLLFNNKKYYTVQEVGQALNLTSQTVTKYIKINRLPAQKVGVRYYIPEDAIELYLEGALRGQLQRGTLEQGMDKLQDTLLSKYRLRRIAADYEKTAKKLQDALQAEGLLKPGQELYPKAETKSPRKSSKQSKQKAGEK